MEQIQLKAVLREEVGKQKVKKLRHTGLVPGVVYHRGDKPVVVSVVDKELSKILQQAGGENVLINLSIENQKAKKPRSVLIKEIQHHPIKRNVLHVDFNEISLTELIQVEVEVVSSGEPLGVKMEGGVLDHSLRVIKIQCYPTDIPKNVEVDVSSLKLGDSIHVRDLHVSDKIKVLTDADTLLFQVKLHVEEKVEEVAATTPELEVIREKKEEEPKPGAEKAVKNEESKVKNEKSDK